MFQHKFQRLATSKVSSCLALTRPPVSWGSTPLSLEVIRVEERVGWQTPFFWGNEKIPALWINYPCVTQQPQQFLFSFALFFFFFSRNVGVENPDPRGLDSTILQAYYLPPSSIQAPTSIGKKATSAVEFARQSPLFNRYVARPVKNVGQEWVYGGVILVLCKLGVSTPTFREKKKKKSAKENKTCSVCCVTNE